MIKQNVMLIVLVGALGFAAGCDFSLCNKNCSKDAQAAQSGECASCSDCSSCSSHTEKKADASAAAASSTDVVSDSEVAIAVEASE